MADAESGQFGQFSIRVRKGDWEVEVSAPNKDFVLEESNRLIEQLKLEAGTPQITPLEIVQGQVTEQDDTGQARIRKQQTLNEFFRQSRPQTHLDKILLLGYWLELRQGQSHFTPDDIIVKYKEVREPPPANVRRDISTLVTKGLLFQPGKSEDGMLAYAVTNSGIEEVESRIAQARI